MNKKYVMITDIVNSKIWIYLDIRIYFIFNSEMFCPLTILIRVGNGVIDI